MVDQGKADLSFAGRLQTIEDQAVTDLSGPVRAQLVELAREATRRWVAAFGSVDAEPDSTVKLARIRDWYAEALTSVTVHTGPALAGLVDVAFTEGTQHAGTIIEAHGDRRPNLRKVLPVDALHAASVADATARARLVKTARMVGSVGSYSDLVTAFGDSHRVLGVIAGQAAFAVFGSAAAGVTALSDRAGLGGVWVAERDACLHCTAYAGKTVDAGQLFPAGLTYADKPSKLGAVKCPPLHPRCRCTRSPWSDRWAPDGVAYPDALAREGQRSVLKGWSLGSESNAARLRAADRLLGTDPKMPASVLAQARRAVRDGKFKSRQVPVPA